MDNLETINTGTQETPETNPVSAPTQPKKWPKIVLLVGFVLVIAGGLVFAGYKVGQREEQIKTLQPISNPTPILTITSAPTPKISPTAIFTSPPELTPTPDPTVDWKTYKSSKVGYSIKAPPSWEVIPNEDDSLLSHQDYEDYVTNMTLVPEGEGEGIIGNSVTIAFPISIQGPHKDLGKQFENGLEGLALPSKDEPSTWFTKQESSYTQVDGRRALIKIKAYKSNPPADFAGGWCDCTHKHIYIDLGNGKILDILGYWQNDNPLFETTFDQILSTFKFLE